MVVSWWSLIIVIAYHRDRLSWWSLVIVIFNQVVYQLGGLLSGIALYTELRILFEIAQLVSFNTEF